MKDFIEDLEMLILNNEDDFDRGKGKYILREFISSIKSAQVETTSVGNKKHQTICCAPDNYLCNLNIHDDDRCTLPTECTYQQIV